MVFISINQYPDKFIVKASGYDSGIVENIKKYKPRQWDPINNVWYIGIPNYNILFAIWNLSKYRLITITRQQGTLMLKPISKEWGCFLV